MRMLALDIEGDGQTPSNPVEIAITEMDGFTLTGVRHHWFVKPPGRISFYATRVHGIDDARVALFPPIAAFAATIREVLGSSPIVGQAVRGDFLSLNRVFPDWQPEAGYDTFKMAKALRQDLPSYKLTGIGAALGLIGQATQMHPGGPHTAPFDATLAALVAVELVRDLDPKRLRHVLQQADIFRVDAKKPKDTPPRLPGI